MGLAKTRTELVGRWIAAFGFCATGIAGSAYDPWLVPSVGIMFVGAALMALPPSVRYLREQWMKRR